MRPARSKMSFFPSGGVATTGLPSLDGGELVQGALNVLDAHVP